MPPQYIRQLVGHALLANRDGIDNDPSAGSKIRHIGVYFSRVGQLIQMDIESIIQETDQAAVLEQIFRAGLPYRRVEIPGLVLPVSSSSSTNGHSPPQ